MSFPAFRSPDSDGEVVISVSDLKLLYQSMMNHLAELLMLASHLHAKGPENLNFDAEMQRLFQEIYEVEQYATRMRLKLKELEKHAL